MCDDECRAPRMIAAIPVAISPVLASTRGAGKAKVLGLLVGDAIVEEATGLVD